MSYSQIKAELGISKSTLSVWLRDMPLPPERMYDLRDYSEVRIERYRETRANTRKMRLEEVYKKVGQDIGTLSERELFLCGLFLYWGEGSKTKGYTVSMSNTDPSVIVFFRKWLNSMGVPDERIRIRLQLYADMEAKKEVEYWSSILGLPLHSFRKPYIKSSNRLGLTYKQRFIHGTCNLIYDNRDIAEYVHMAMEWIQSSFVATDVQI